MRPREDDVDVLRIDQPVGDSGYGPMRRWARDRKGDRVVSADP